MQLKETCGCSLIFNFILLFLIFLSPSFALSAEGQGRDNSNQFAFAEDRFNEGDYYRAITEYKRFIFFYPQDKLAEKSTFRIAESYFGAMPCYCFTSLSH
jgi:TolA-binding protein